MAAKKDNVRKIKAYIDDILGAKSNLREKLPSRQNYKKQLFSSSFMNSCCVLAILFYKLVIFFCYIFT